MSEVTLAEGCTRLPPKAKKIEIPYLVAKLLSGGVSIPKYQNKDDVVAVKHGTDIDTYHVEDYELADRIAREINVELLQATVLMPQTVMQVHRLAARKVAEVVDKREKTKGIVMLKDGYAGSGWWRMVLPSKHMNLEDWHIDVTAAEIQKYEHLLEYETIFVQRLHDWESFYMLERLAKAGKRIVYDLDDDFFRIPLSNPVSHVIGRDQQIAARECMRIAHAVTCTTEIMKQRLVLEEIEADKIHVLPNSLDCSDRWLPTEETGSPDGNLRIFWQGGATHAEDWLECADAVDQVMREMPNVILMILGALPPIVGQMARQPHWKNRVQYLSFGKVETYYEMIHHVRADVGIAPLEDTTFNQAKSPIKWLEYTLIGMPTVASDVSPYLEVIENGKTGRLVAGVDEWTEAILSYLKDAEERKRTVGRARLQASDLFDLPGTAEKWAEILTVS